MMKRIAEKRFFLFAILNMDYTLSVLAYKVGRAERIGSL